MKFCRECGTPVCYYFLIEQFFVNKHKRIFLKCSETFSDRYGMEDLNIATQLESVLSGTAKRSTTSGVCDFCKDSVNEEQLYNKI